MADELNVPVTKVRPTDRFAEELKPVPGWEYGLRVERGKIETLDDYIRLRVVEATSPRKARTKRELVSFILRIGWLVILVAGLVALLLLQWVFR